MPKVVVGVKIYSYRSDGLHVITPRKLGTIRPAEEIITYERLSEKQKKMQRKLDAIHRRNNGAAQKKVIR